jgi:hypothetical protein
MFLTLKQDNLDKNKTTAFIPLESYCEPKDYFYFELKLLVDSEYDNITFRNVN